MPRQEEVDHYRKLQSIRSTRRLSSIKHFVPEWALVLFVKASDDLLHLSQLHFLSVRGLKALITSPDLLGFFTELDEPGEKPIVPQETLLRAKEEAALAKSEVEQKYPLLNAWAVVGLWSLLEALVHDFVARWLKHTKDVWQIDALSKVRVRIGEYERLSSYERSVYLAEILERELVSDKSAFQVRFETVFDAFGLGGSLPTELKKSIYELCQVRNAVVHQNATADRRLQKACPWLKIKPGKPIRISEK
jgi:hypothetical protein